MPLGIPHEPGDRRFRARSPPRFRPKVSGDRCVCLQPIGDAKPWLCINSGCPIVAHESCMLSPGGRPAGAASTGDQMQRTPGRKGCPLCRTRLQDAIQYFKNTPQFAPQGAWCATCWRPIPPGTLMMRCAAPRSHCVAVYHKHCVPWAVPSGSPSGRTTVWESPDGTCHGCGLSIPRWRPRRRWSPGHSCGLSIARWRPRRRWSSR